MLLTRGLNIISTSRGLEAPWTVPDRTLMVARCLRKLLDLKKRSFW